MHVQITWFTTARHLVPASIDIDIYIYNFKKYIYLCLPLDVFISLAKTQSMAVRFLNCLNDYETMYIAWHLIILRQSDIPMISNHLWTS